MTAARLGVSQWTFAAAADRATPVTPAPRPASSAYNQKTPRAPVTTSEAPQLLPTLGVEPVHLSREVHQRSLAVVLDQRADFGGRTRLEVLRARHRRLVDVGLALAATNQQPLPVEASHRRHDRRVLALFRRASVELVEHSAHVALAKLPQKRHELGLKLMQLRRCAPGHHAQRLARLLRVLSVAAGAPHDAICAASVRWRTWIRSRSEAVLGGQHAGRLPRRTAQAMCSGQASAATTATISNAVVMTG